MCIYMYMYIYTCIHIYIHIYIYIYIFIYIYIHTYIYIIIYIHLYKCFKQVPRDPHNVPQSVVLAATKFCTGTFVYAESVL